MGDWTTFPSHTDWFVDESSLTPQKVCDCESCRAASAKPVIANHDEVLDIRQWAAEHPELHSCDVCGNDSHCTKFPRCDGSCFDVRPEGYSD